MIGSANLDGSDPDYSFIAGPSRSMATDSAHLYWHDGGAIARANLDGTEVDTNFISDPGGAPNAVYGLDVEGSHIYWANYQGSHGEESTIGRANLDGTGVDPNFIGGLGYPVLAVAVDSQRIYWTNGYDRAVGRASLDGTGVDSEFIDDSRGSFFGQADGLAVDSSHIYWSHQHQGETTWIARADLDGTHVQSRFIATKFDGYVPQLAVDSKHIYWNGPAGVARANLDGTGVDLDFMPGTATQGGPVAANSSRVYWGSGWRYPLFTVGNARRHEHRGTAKLPVTVSGPGELVLGGHGLRSVSKTVASDETYQLAVKPKGRKKRKLERRGHVRVWTKVTLALPGTDPRARVTPVELIQR